MKQTTKKTQKKHKNLHAKYRVFGLLFLLMFFSACATSAPKLPITPPIQSEAELLWDSFFASKKTQKNMRPYTLSGSIRLGYANDTHRVTYILWSNGTLPLRLDIQAGIGVSVAKIEETKKTLLVYLPQEKKAFQMKGASSISALLALGMPMPISFLDLSHLLRGNFAHAFGGIRLNNIDLNAGSSTEEKYNFHFETKKIFGSIRLNALALPVECNINNEWKIFIEYDENKVPYKVKLSSLFEDYKAILLVKDTKITDTYADKKLKLILPQGTKLVVN